MIKDSVNKMDKKQTENNIWYVHSRKRVYLNMHKTYQHINKKKKSAQNEKMCREKS